MDSQRLTDADFEPIAPSAGTDQAPASDLDGGYPAWETPGVASLAPETEQPPDAAVSAQPTEASQPDPTPEAAPETPEAVTADAAEGEQPESEAAPDPFAEERARYEAEIAARDERVAQYEANERQLARQNLDNAAIWEEQQLDARLNHEWATKVIPHSNRLQGAARDSFLIRQRADFDQGRDAGRREIAAIHRQELQTILANDPQVRQDFYSQLIEQHGLPEEARARLAEVPPEAVDGLIPRLRAEYAQMSAKDRENDQLRRELEVYKRSERGADAMGGTASSGGTPPDPRLDPSNPTYSPELAYAGAGQWVRGRF